MPDLVVRPAVVEDAAAVAEVCNALSQALYGDADADAATIAAWFNVPDMAMLVAEREGRVVAYADVRNEERIRFPIDARVHPELGDPDVGVAIVGAAEDWARGHAQPGGGTRAYVAEPDAIYRQAVEQLGYDLIRHAFQMEIELSEPVGEPEWPEGVHVRTFDPDRDDEAVWQCAEEAFADHFDFHPVSLDAWRGFRASDPRFDPALWWLVEDGEDVAAVSLNRWHVSGDPLRGWIDTLGVRRQWRRRGLGLALLLHSFRDFAARGATRVGLDVDGENTTGAVRLYERAGMNVIRRADTYSRTL